MDFKNSNQLKSFLKKESKRLNISISSVYTTFFAREFLYRLSKYNHDEILIKGSSAEITYLGRLVRAITDIDLASLNNYNEVMPILVDSMNDFGISNIDYQLSNISKTPTGIYQLSLVANLDTIKQPLGIDFQERYNRLIEPVELVMPPIFEDDRPFPVYVPSYEEYLAEKLCIIIESNKPDVLNTRVKDFYDIYQLHGGKYDPDKLTEYFKKMVKLRGKATINQADTQILNREFIESHREVWETTKRKYDFLDKEIDLEGAVYYTRGVLREQLQKNGQEMPVNAYIPYQKTI